MNEPITEPIMVASPDGPITLPVMEAFYTLQGEGVFQGRAAWFIRLGGCDVGCVWCDVKESWNADVHPRYPIDAIVQQAAAHPGRIAVVTGGEPLMHDCAPLTTALHESGFRTHIETSGAYPVSGDWDWICLSPKKFKAPRPDALRQADELKVVIYHPSDLAWAEKHALSVGDHCELLLQPEWSRRDTMVPLIVDYIKTHPRWRFSGQMHKYIHVP